ncbi:MAG: serine/threonine protein kinase, partial [Planctomycetes bacterium]|nr:serine/threonine protein kinase [Planctomycetota bacterium]
DPELFIVIPLLTGQTLREILIDGTLTNPKERQERVVAWTRELADALQHAHALGVVHRDVEPGNVMIVADRAVLFDFGVARWTDGSATTLTDEGNLIGTPEFMAPELVDSERTTPRSEVFALGVTLFWGLTGKKPFAGRDRASLFRAIAQGEFDVEALRRARVDPHLIAVVKAAPEPDPYDRYESAAAMGDDLRRIQVGDAPRILRRRLLRSLFRWARRNTAAAIFGALLVVGAMATVGLGAYLRRGEAAYRTAEESQALRDLDFALTDAFVELLEGRTSEAREAFQALSRHEGPGARPLRPEIDLGLRSLGLASSDASSADESPAFQAFASASAFLVSATTGVGEADAARATERTRKRSPSSSSPQETGRRVCASPAQPSVSAASVTRGSVRSSRPASRRTAPFS